MTRETTIIPLGPRGAAFLGVAGLAVPITTGLRVTTDHSRATIRRADIGGTQSKVLFRRAALSEGMHDVWMP